MEIKYEQKDLYHYTSIDTLYAIVKNRTIRLTDYRFLNDKKELTFGINAIKKSKRKSKINVPIVDKLISNVEKNISEYQLPMWLASNDRLILKPQTCFDTKIYTLSTSYENDSKYMWKHYAKNNGCRLKLNGAKLSEYVNKVNDEFIARGFINVIRGDVLYGRKVKNLFGELICQHLIEKDDFIYNAYNVFYQLCALHKAKKWTKEHEYRIGLRFLDEWFEDEYAYDALGKEKIVKKINVRDKSQLELLNFPVEDIIEDVMISPYGCTKNTEEIENFLKVETGKDIPVFKQIKKYN